MLLIEMLALPNLDLYVVRFLLNLVLEYNVH